MGTTNIDIYPANPEEVRFGAESILFVEGAVDKGDHFDEDILNILVGDQIAVKPLGPSYSIRDVAQALHYHHPFYYFLIDRDAHHDDDFVSDSWKNFPDPEKHNLLIWKKKEIENYFLDGKFLSQSRYLDARYSDDKQDLLDQEIVKHAGKRLYMDTANYVIISIREELKKTWINTFSSENRFRTKEDALRELLSAEAFKNRPSDVSRKVSQDEIRNRFDRFLQKMTGGQEPIVVGQGNWVNMIKGKAVLNSVINSSCFKFSSQNGSLLQGPEKVCRVIADILKDPSCTIPDDFEELKKLIRNRKKPA